MCYVPVHAVGMGSLRPATIALPTSFDRTAPLIYEASHTRRFPQLAETAHVPLWLARAPLGRRLCAARRGSPGVGCEDGPPEVPGTASTPGSRWASGPGAARYVTVHVMFAVTHRAVQGRRCQIRSCLPPRHSVPRRACAVGRIFPSVRTRFCEQSGIVPFRLSMRHIRGCGMTLYAGYL